MNETPPVTQALAVTWSKRFIEVSKPPRRPVLFLVAAGAALVASACSDLTVPRDCGSSSFTISVTTPAQPTRPRYSWDAGRASQLRVSRASDPIFPAWRIAADDPTGFAPPVDHGTVPDGASFVDGDETTLQSGVRYCVTVRLVGGQEGMGEFGF